MIFGPETLPLDLSDNNMRIHIEIDRYDDEVVDDFDQGVQLQYRNNKVITYYNYNDSEGNWGSVGEHYVTTMDLANIAVGFQDILSQKTDLFEYKTVVDDMGNPFMVICCKRGENSFSLRIQVAEGLFQEWLILELPQLTFEQFDEYAQVFIRWAKDYPILSEEELKVAKEIPW